MSGGGDRPTSCHQVDFSIVGEGLNAMHVHVGCLLPTISIENTQRLKYTWFFSRPYPTCSQILMRMTATCPGRWLSRYWSPRTHTPCDHSPSGLVHQPSSRRTTLDWESMPVTLKVDKMRITPAFTTDLRPLLFLPSPPPLSSPPPPSPFPAYPTPIPSFSLPPSLPSFSLLTPLLLISHSSPPPHPSFR